MLLAILHVPADPAAAQHAAEATDMHVVDARQRIAGMLPRVLLADTDGERLADACRALEANGFIAAVIDPARVPGDQQRIVARSLALPPHAPADHVIAIAGVGNETRHEIPLAAVTLLQRGARTVVETETTETTQKKLAPGRALLTGGLVMRKKVTTRTTHTHHDHQPFLLLQRDDGGDDVVLYETMLDYRFLGAEMQPSGRGNFEQMVTRLRALTSATLDMRMTRTGFANRLTGFAIDPVDLGLHLIRLAHARGC